MAVGWFIFVAIAVRRLVIEVLRHPNLIPDFHGFVGLPVAGVGERAFLPAIGEGESGGESDECENGVSDVHVCPL